METPKDYKVEEVQFWFDLSIFIYNLYCFLSLYCFVDPRKISNHSMEVNGDPAWSTVEWGEENQSGFRQRPHERWFLTAPW